MKIEDFLNMLFRKQIKATFICFSVFISVSNFAYAHKASLQNIVIDDANGDLIVSYKLKNVFSSQMQKVVLNGIPITFTYHVVLHEIRDFWIDKKIINLKIDHMLKYNVLKKEFIIKRSWRIDEVLITDSFEEAQGLMTEVSGLKIIPFNWLDSGARYQVGIKAELSKANLPVHLRSALFFSPSWGLTQIGIW